MACAHAFVSLREKDTGVAVQYFCIHCGLPLSPADKTLYETPTPTEQ